MADNANKEIKTATADDGSTGYEMKIGLGTIAMLISATGMGLVPLFSRWATRTDMFDGALGLNAGDSIGALMAVGRMSMGVLFFVVIMLMLLPFQVTMVPNVITLRAMGLLDTVWSVILPMTVAPFYIFLLRQYMVGLPNDMIEAAQIDGAGTLRCFVHVVMPVCQPILGAAIALSFADCWNLVEQPLTYLTTHTELYPLSVAFNQLTQKSTGVEFAGAALYTLPALFIYLFFQNDILEGVQLTELK